MAAICCILTQFYVRSFLSFSKLLPIFQYYYTSISFGFTTEPTFMINELKSSTEGC